ncbi:MAG: pitrilysin family protein [Candidatus Eisenbacteria bacterium]
MRATTIAALALLFLLAPFAAAQDVEYEKYELSNGMTVILHEDHSLPLATINFWYRVGAKDEKEGRSGFAHLFEHLMFMGTERVPGSDFDNLMDAGGGWNNASTGHDRTNYFSVGPRELLPMLLWLDADRMEDLGRMMDQEKLDKQRDVVRNERREGLENEPYGKAEFEINRLMYPPDHPYHWDVIGTHEDLEAATVRDVKDFFAAYYVPNNTSLVVAGDFDPAEIKPLIEKLFGTIPRSPDPIRAKKVPVGLTETKRVTYTDDVQFGRLYLVYHSPAFYGPGDAEMDLAGQILSDGKSSRLYKRLVYEDELATDVSAYQLSGELGSLFRVVVTARQGVSLDGIEKVTDEVIEKFAAEGPTEEELERYKASWERNMLSGLQNLYRKADRLNQYEYYFGEPNSFRADLDRFRNATAKDVKRFAGMMLRPEARLVMRVLPEEEGAVLAGRDETPGSGVAGAFLPSPPETFTLSNGIPVRHWERTELPLVEVSIGLRAGAAHMDGEGAGAGCANLTADMLDEGAGDRSAFEFSDALDMLGASFSVNTTPEYTMVRLSSLGRNFDESLGLSADALLRPRFDPKEWDRVKALHLEGLRQMEDRPRSVAMRVGMRAYFGDDHPYGSPGEGTTESVEALALDDLKNAWARNFAPGNATIFIAGDLTGAEAKAALERAFGGWNDPAGFTPAAPVPAKDPATSHLRVVVVDREDAVQTVIRFFMPGPLGNDPDRVGYELVNTVLGGSFTSRLNANLREKNGYTYGAGSRYMMNPSAGYQIAFSDVQAEVTGAALGEFFKEFDNIRGGDITPEEARKTRETNRMDTVQSFQGLGGLVGTAMQFEFLGRPFAAIGDDLGAMARITEGDLNALAAKTVPLDRGLLVLVGDKDVILEQIRDLDLPAAEVMDVNGEGM